MRSRLPFGVSRQVEQRGPARLCEEMVGLFEQTPMCYRGCRTTSTSCSHDNALQQMIISAMRA